MLDLLKSNKAKLNREHGKRRYISEIKIQHEKGRKRIAIRTPNRREAKWFRIKFSVNRSHKYSEKFIEIDIPVRINPPERKDIKPQITETMPMFYELRFCIYILAILIVIGIISSER